MTVAGSALSIYRAMRVIDDLRRRIHRAPRIHGSTLVFVAVKNKTSPRCRAIGFMWQRPFNLMSKVILFQQSINCAAGQTIAEYDNLAAFPCPIKKSAHILAGFVTLKFPYQSSDKSFRP